MKIFSARTLSGFAAGFTALILALPNLHAAPGSPTNLPSPANIQINFDRDIHPILATSCLSCHGPQKPRSDFRLDYRDAALSGGDDNTNDIVPGNSTNSLLIAYVSRRVPDMEMPPRGKGAPLTPQQISLLRTWIDQGASWGTTNELPPPTVTIEPIIGGTDVHGNQGKFRELEGTKEGLSGGMQNFSMSQQLSQDETISLDGHLIAPEQDFGFNMKLDKTDLGFVDTGVEQWRKYYATDGGYDPTVIPSQFNLNNNLYVDDGRAWINLGLDLPRWPEIVFGYEYRYRQGNESTLDWGTANGKNIYPASQLLDEQTHTIKLDLTANLDDWRLENNGRLEFYTEKNQGAEADILFGGANPDEFITTKDNYRQVQGMDTLVLEKQLRDWWFFNGGFYYSRVSGKDYFDQTTTIPSFGLNSVLSSQKITLKRESEIFSVANLFSPLSYLTVSLGTQNEWTDEDGFGESIPDLELGGNIPANSSLVEFKASQNANFRFTRIPFTIISGDAQFSEDNYSVYQAEDTTELQRETLANNFRYDLKTGFSVSPWPWADLATQYERRSSDTDYNQADDLFLDVPGPTNGYPGFILNRTITSDQFEAKLVLRPALWLKTTLTYQISKTDYSSKTDPAFDIIVDETVSDGGPVVDGDYHLQTYGIATTVTPLRQLFVTGAFTYSHSRVTTADNGDPSLVPYEGDIFTLTAATTYALSVKTSLQLSYNFSSANYSENNAAAGIPAGLDFTRHDVFAGVTQKLAKDVSASLRYGFSQYSEPSSNGANNYHANSIFGTLTFRF